MSLIKVIQENDNRLLTDDFHIHVASFCSVEDFPNYHF